MTSRYEQFASAISCIYHDIQRIQRVEMAKFGLKGPHAQCLLAIRRHPEGITAAGLCQECEKDKAAISRTLAELEKAGMVLRQDIGGKRYRSSLTLTEQGAAAARAVDRKASQAVELAAEGYDDQAREVFYNVLSLIAGSLRGICREGLGEEPV